MITSDRSRSEAWMRVQQVRQFGAPPVVVDLLEVVGVQPAQPGADLVDQPLRPRRPGRTRAAPSGRRAAAPAGTPTTAGSGCVEQHQLGHGGHTDVAQVAAAVDDRRFACHERRLGDRLLGARRCGRWVSVARSSAVSPSPRSIRLPMSIIVQPTSCTIDSAGHPGQREHPGQRLLLCRREQRVALGERVRR